MSHSWSMLSSTAVVVAALRAAESARPDRLFDDPYAEELVAAAGPDPGLVRVFLDPDALTGEYFALRTRFLDDVCRTAGLDQVVVAAAGLDTRAQRLDWPAGTRLFELDTAPVLEFKAEVLRPVPARCERVGVPADFLGGWAGALLGAGFRPDRPTLWLVEGLLLYLPADDQLAMLRQLHELSAPGSRAGIEDVGGAAVRVPAYAEWARRSDLPFTPLYAKDSWHPGADDLNALGWRTTRVTPAEAAARHGRPVPPLWDRGVPGSAAALGLGGHFLDAALPAR